MNNTKQNIITNPVLHGVFPDPSWIWHDGQAWLVTSSFGQVPGLPIHTSRDLAHWERRGSAIDAVMSEKLFLKHIHTDNRGVFAPTIRECGDAIIIVSTVVSVDAAAALAGGADPAQITAMQAANGNFALISHDEGRSWEGPHWIEGARGNDPDFFMDEDGTAWWTASRPSDNPHWPHQSDIWMRRLDMEQWRLEGPEHIIWHGAVEGATWAESPHIFRLDGRYYLLAAEAGTERHHAQSVARCDTLNDTYYENNPRNPILTHRTLGEAFPVQNVGHADMLRDDEGRWWGVCLGSRVVDGLSFMGREPFVFPIEWEDGWPVFAPGQGVLPHVVQIPKQSAAYDELNSQSTPDIQEINDEASILLLPAQPDWRWTRVDCFDCTVFLDPMKARAARIQQNRNDYAQIAVNDDGRTVTACVSQRGQATQMSQLPLDESSWYGIRLNGRTLEFVERGGMTSVSDTGSTDTTNLTVPLLVRRTAIEGLRTTAGGWPVIAGAPGRREQGETILATTDAAFLSTEVAGGYIGCLAGVR